MTAPVTFRPLSDPADYAGMLAVRLDSAPHDQIDPRSSREGLPDEANLRQNFELKPGEPNPDVLLAEASGKIVGYGHIAWRWTEASGVRVYLHLGHVLPEWRGKGVGTHMLAWCQDRIGEHGVKDKADERAVFATNASTTEVEATALIRDAGYAAIRHLTDMAATPALLAVRPLPAGLDVRPAEAAHHRAIYQSLKDAHSELPLSRPESEEDFDEFLADYVRPSSYDPTLWQIAWSGDLVVGVVLARFQAGAGHITEVGVRKAWRRRGVGHSLMQRAMSELHRRGVDHVRLFTDAENTVGARSLYEAVGFREIKQHVLYRKPLKARDAATGTRA